MKSEIAFKIESDSVFPVKDIGILYKVPAYSNISVLLVAQTVIVLVV